MTRLLGYNPFHLNCLYLTPLGPKCLMLDDMDNLTAEWLPRCPNNGCVAYSAYPSFSLFADFLVSRIRQV